MFAERYNKNQAPLIFVGGIARTQSIDRRRVVAQAARGGQSLTESTRRALWLR